MGLSWHIPHVLDHASCCVQVLLSYGNKGNAELLLGYGFVQPVNPHDTVRIGDMTHLAQDAAARGLLRPHWPPGSLQAEALDDFGAVSLFPSVVP